MSTVKCLVTGGAGYIGSVLTHHLLHLGHEVKCLDRFFFGRESLKDVSDDPRLELIQDDIRWFDPNVLRGVEAVFDLAALSNDPSGELDPAKTYDINYLGRVRVAKLAKEYGVGRYIFVSTCSVYGFREGVLDESSPTNPLTAYAKSSLIAERDILALADSGFVVTAPRFATNYGLSYRMRFDLAINGMALNLFNTHKIPVMRDGTQWRPFVHVRDCIDALRIIAEGDSGEVNGQIINVGSNEQNYQIYELAKLVGDALSEPYEIEWYGDPDKRSYRVNFDKAEEILGFRAKLTPADAAKEIVGALKKGEQVDSPKTVTVKWYKYLQETHKMIKEVALKDTIL